MYGQIARNRTQGFKDGHPLGLQWERFWYDYSHEDISAPEQWQLEDLHHLVKQRTDRVANWSEMGAKKTSTGLWYIQRRMKELGIKKPNVLAVTTRSGKGTFFDLAPKILQGWTIFNVGTQGLSVLINGHELKLPPKEIKFVPQRFDMPTLVVAHYAIFSKSNAGQPETDPETGEAIIDKKGNVVMKQGTQADHIVRRLWDFVWLDEAHRIKDKDTRWTIVLKRNKSPRRMVTTGTGFINRPDEIWSLLNFLDKNRYPGYWDFKEEYCEIEEDFGYSRVIGVKPEKKQEFRRLVRALGPRRMLDEVMPHIKKPIFVPHPVDLNATQRKMYDSIKSELRALDQQGTPLYASNVLVLLQRLRAICVATPEVVADYYDEKEDRRVQKIKLVEPSSKLDALMEIIDGMEWDDDARQPVVVFSNFVGPLMLLQARFDKANRNALEMGFPPEYPYLWLKESDNDQVRYNKWHDLFPTLEYRVFMATVQLGGESINLTPARHAIFLDRSWSPKDNSQGIGRIRRPGQEGQPIVININAKNTTDQRVEHVNNVKQGWFQEIFGEEG